ncbi:alpha/beta hydrolase [Rhizorhabdus argentea]|uniref:alpha/beta hydrolase n=1 Tax=Rhizorhabdus argentea TaxID=1387174 RepID=UPI0030ED1345
MNHNAPGPHMPSGPLHPIAERVAGFYAQDPLWQGLTARPAAQTRAAIEAAAQALALETEVEPVDHVEELVVSVGDSQIGAKLYRPFATARGLVVWVHGGGFVLGSSDRCDSFSRRLANRSGCAIVSLDYRLAPEHPFPTPVNDVLTATHWLANRRVAMAGAEVPLILAGDSAGGNLAAVVTRKMVEAGNCPLAAQILVYPCTDDSDAASLRRFVPPFLNRAEIAWFYDQYDPGRTARNHPDFAPLLASRLAGLPPALIITAEHDILTEQAEHYGRRMAAAGVDVRTSRYAGMIHGFATMDVFFDGVAGEAIDEMSTFISEQLTQR